MKHQFRTRVLVDTTQTCLQGMNTGIQRVVRNVALRADSVGARHGIEILPVVGTCRGFRALTDPAQALAVRTVPSVGAVPGRHPTDVRSGAALVKRVLRLSPRFYRSLQHAWYRLQRRRLLAQVSDRTPLGWRGDDVLLLLDRFWGDTVEPGGTISLAQRHCPPEVRLIPVIYDLIPCTHPQFFDASSVTCFMRGLSSALASAVGIVTISATVAEQVRARAAGLTPSVRRALRVDYAYLGSDFASVSGPSPGTLGARAWPAGLWSGNPVFLMLGTLEPRKGHSFVLDAFEQRWRAGGRETLLFIGAPGWRMDAEMERFRTSPRQDRSFFVVQNADDAAVLEAIARSRAGILASVAEGFGLPIVEFLQCGLPVLASDIPVFREVGGDFPLYFPLDQPASLAAAVDRFYAQEEALRRRMASFRWPTWDVATDAFIDRVLSLAQGGASAD